MSSAKHLLQRNVRKPDRYRPPPSLKGSSYVDRHPKASIPSFGHRAFRQSHFVRSGFFQEQVHHKTPGCTLGTLISRHGTPRRGCGWRRRYARFPLGCAHRCSLDVAACRARLYDPSRLSVRGRSP